MVNKNIKPNKSFKNVYSDIFNYIRTSKNCIYTILIFFFISFFIGYFFPIFFIENIKGLIANLLEKTKDLSGTGLVLFIFGNNFLVSFSSILFGLFFGIIPLVTSIANGYVLGFVAGFAASQEGILVLWRLFPHGIFELPAIFLSLALGLRIGLSFFKKNPKKELKFCLKNSFKTFVFLIIPLLIIAAIIEGLLISIAG